MSKEIDCYSTSLNMRRMMQERHITPKQVKKELGLESVQAVYKWMSTTNSALPSIDNLLRLSSMMNCTIEDILITYETD
ncbi:MAG: helix-turn-helix transcriptional regulator [Lachnospiraceae bacterium]|nr:helix-turn-helix transcriptional regulator [Lachnospiraceae bacterium]